MRGARGKRLAVLDESVHEHVEMVDGVGDAVPNQVARRQCREDLVVGGQAAAVDHAMRLLDIGTPGFDLLGDPGEPLFVVERHGVSGSGHARGYYTSLVMVRRPDALRPFSLLGEPDVDLTLQHTNRTVLVEGPEITICPVGIRCLLAGGA